ncbi:MAG: DUF1501 domain-containing protein [Planctomycetia bacterium]|nr:DUF1501 domain-containing protein [Planctomycetia bacterium]
MFPNLPLASCPTRRSFLKHCALSGLGLSLPQLLALRGLASSSTGAGGGGGFGQAKSCIVFFAWGGVSQLETWDPKPDAPAEVRGTYRPISTATPGVQLGEYMPTFARLTEKLAIVRSAHHAEAGHRNAAYWNLTGHAPHTPGNDTTILPSRRDWPCLGSMVARFKPARTGLPGTVTMPYPSADRGLVNGQSGGFLGMQFDPLVIAPAKAKPYAGVSPHGGTADLRLPDGVDMQRMQQRGQLASQLGGSTAARAIDARAFENYRTKAADLLLNSEVAAAFDLERESPKLRDAYGEHICGQSALLARRLSEAGVPLVMIYASAGDLNGSSGDNWDTHGDNFNRLKNALLPPLERASAALLEDLAQRGTLDSTLVVWLTEFGRTPKLNGGKGRDHFPNCYSVAFAGGGVRGGQVYGRSDRQASEPSERPCGPQDLHATIFHALGIPLDSHLTDNLGRPLALTDGQLLPLF